MGTVTTAHPKDQPWLESGRPTKDGLLWGKVFMKPLITPTPNVLEIWYEPGWNSLRHSHPMDEIFYMLDGKLWVNGYELDAGSVAFVPKNTMYGPEYTMEEGAHFWRVEMWDSEHPYEGGPSAPMVAGVHNLRVWEGALQPNGAPEAKTPDPAVPPPEQSKEGVVGALVGHASQAPWTEITDDGTEPGTVFFKRLLSPNPEVVETWRAPGRSGTPLTHADDKLFCVIDGELGLQGQLAPAGSVVFVPKGTECQPEAKGPNGVRCLEVTLLDSATK